MISSNIVEKYAAQTHDVILAEFTDLKDLTEAFLAHLLSNKAKSAVALLQQLLKMGSVAQIAGLIEEALDGKSLDIKLHQLMGRVFRAAIPAMGAAADADEALQNQDFIYVVGTSNARGFGSSPFFFPIFAYIGRQTFTLNDEKFEDCTRRTKKILERLVPGKPVLMILGSEPRLLLENVFKMRDQEFGGLLENDYELMDVAARKYKEMGLELKKVAKGPLHFLVPMPTYTDDTNTLTKRMIEKLYEELEGTDIGLIDPYDSFIDPETGILEESLQSSKDEEELHFNHIGLQRIMRSFIEQDLLPEGSDEADLYQWHNLMSINMGEGDEVRIWCDPAKSMKSDMAAATMMGGHLVDYVSSALARKPAEVIAVLNSYQGYLPFCIPQGLAQKTLAFSNDERHVASAQRLLHFTGRNDIEALHDDTISDQSAPIDALLVQSLPKDNWQDVQDNLIKALDTMKPERVYVYSPEIHMAPNLDAQGYRVEVSANFNNRHLSDEWKVCVLTTYVRA